MEPDSGAWTVAYHVRSSGLGGELTVIYHAMIESGSGLVTLVRTTHPGPELKSRHLASSADAADAGGRHPRALGRLARGGPAARRPASAVSESAGATVRVAAWRSNCRSGPATAGAGPASGIGRCHCGAGVGGL